MHVSLAVSSCLSIYQAIYIYRGSEHKERKAKYGKDHKQDGRGTLEFDVIHFLSKISDVGPNQEV